MRARVLMLAAVLAAGTAGGYAVLERARSARPPSPHVAPAPPASPDATAASSAPALAARPAPPTSFAPPAAREASSSDARPPASDAVETKARRLAAREPYVRADLRRLLERVFAGKLGDRELGSEDYERLVDATLRLRAALRVLRGTDESAATAAVREQQRETVRAIFAEIEAITGLPPAELGSVLTSDEEEPGDAGSP